MAENILARAIEEPYEDYWYQLGKFVHQFSHIERSMQSVLRYLAGVSDSTGAAVFSGVKVDAASSLINRLCDANGLTFVKDRLKPALDQLGAINGVRNNILHWGANHDASDGQFVVSNSYWAASPDRLREYRVRPVDILAMTVDLHHIGLILSRETFANEEVEASPILTKLFGEAHASAWSYKPPQQSPPKKQSPKKSPKPPRQHGA